MRNSNSTIVLSVDLEPKCVSDKKREIKDLEFFSLHLDKIVLLNYIN